MSRPGAQSNEYRKKPHLIAVPPLRNTADHRQKQSHRRKSQGSPPLYISLLNLTLIIARHSSLVSSKRGRALPQMQRHRSRRPCKVLPPTSMRRTPRSLSLAAPSCPLFGNFATTTCLLSTKYFKQDVAPLTNITGDAAAVSADTLKLQRLCTVSSCAESELRKWICGNGSAEMDLRRCPLSKRPLQCRSIHSLAGPSSQSSRPTLSLHLCRERSATVSSSHME